MKCAICGRESQKSICSKCYVERNEVIWIDSTINLTQCPRCGFFKLDRWRDVNYEKALEEELRSSLCIHSELKVTGIEISKDSFETDSPLLRSMTVNVSGVLWGEKVKQSRTFTVRILKELCTKCSRKAGGYYESIVQVRAEDRSIGEDELKTAEEVVKAVIFREKENEKAFISKVVERREGIDYYIGDRNVGRKISKRIVEELGGVIKESKRISGRKDGRDIYRFTYSIRLPAYRRGDIVEKDGKLAVVTNPKLDKGISLETGEGMSLKKGRVVARKKDIAKSVVVDTDSVVEILHPVTQKVVTARTPVRLKPGDEVYVFEHKGRIHVIPKELEE